MKFFQDFGITAWFGTLIILGSFGLMTVALLHDTLAVEQILPMIGAWVGSIVTAYFVIKGIKSNNGGNNNAN